MMRRCSAVPSSYVAVADRVGAPGSGKVRFHSGFLPPPRFFLFPLSRLDVVWCCATSGGGEWAEGLGSRALAFIAELQGLQWWTVIGWW